HNEPVRQQQRHGSDDRHAESGRVALLVPSQHSPDATAEPAADHADQRRDDESAGIPSRKEQLGDDADEQTEERLAKHVDHRARLRVWDLAPLPRRKQEASPLDEVPRDPAPPSRRRYVDTGAIHTLAAAAAMTPPRRT